MYLLLLIYKSGTTTTLTSGLHFWHTTIPTIELLIAYNSALFETSNL